MQASKAKAKKAFVFPELNYGPVFIIRGRHKGRIGYYDDDADDPFRGIVTFGDYLLSRGHYLIDKRYMREVTINDLLSRYNDLTTVLFRTAWDPTVVEEDIDWEAMYSALSEAHYVYTTLEHMNLQAKYGKKASACFSHIVRRTRVSSAKCMMI
jgi:hypothetical protein